MTYVYKLTDPNGRIRYIGITDNVEDRKRKHQRYRKPHTFDVISEQKTRFDAGLEEIRLIQEFNTHVSKGGWNKTWGGEDCNVLGVSRKGIGGRKKGDPTINKGRKFSAETRAKMSRSKKGKVYHLKLTEEQVTGLIYLYKQQPAISLAGTIRPNGRVLPYDRAFCQTYAEQFGITPANAYHIIKGKSISWAKFL